VGLFLGDELVLFRVHDLFTVDDSDEMPDIEVVEEGSDEGIGNEEGDCVLHQPFF